MRNCLFTLVCFFVATTLYAQRTFGAGLVAGINGCQIHGDSYYGYDEPGFMAGALIHNRPGEKWQFQFGIQYSRKGAQHRVPRNQGGYSDFEIRLNYVEVPLVARYNTPKVFFDFGLSAGYLFKSREWDAAGEIPSRDFRKMEFALITGIGYNLPANFFMELEAVNSVIPIVKFSLPVVYGKFFADLFNRGMYNNILSLKIGVRFGGEGND